MLFSKAHSIFKIIENADFNLMLVTVILLTENLNEDKIIIPAHIY